MLLGKRHISARPAAIEARKKFGHWEGDTVIGSDRHNCILTLVVRKTGLSIIKKLNARTSAEVNKALLEILAERSEQFKTITFDNGTEFHGYAEIERCFPSVICYFATPYHSWERGSNENLNGLIRQYIPKGENIFWINQARCDHIAKELNSRPRKRLHYQTPQEVFNAEKF